VQIKVKRGSIFGSAEDPYEVGDELGSGTDSRVFACWHCQTGEQFAVKVVNLQRMRLMGDLEAHVSRLDREVRILRQLRHPRIVNLQGFHRTDDSYFLVMERVKGGELFNRIVLNKSLTEVEARHVFHQLLEGVGYMHSKSIIHRDLKPENILIVDSRPADHNAAEVLLDVKIADFGLSKIIHDGASLAKTCVGTPQYWAPEVLNTQRDGGTYDQAVDLWGLGAVLFVMLCGRYPFDGKRVPLDEQIRTAAFNMGSAKWRSSSESAKNLICGLLKVDASKRLHLDDCLCHPWVLGRSVSNTPPRARQKVRRCSRTQAAPRQAHHLQDCERSRSKTAARRRWVCSILCTLVMTGLITAVVFWICHFHFDKRLSTGMFTWAAPALEAVGMPHNQTIAEAAGVHQQVLQVPLLQLTGQGAKDACPEQDEQESIFRLSELLKLQVSIAGSLEMACLAFRHADLELADATRRTFHQARDLFQQGADVVSRYARVAQQVRTTVLPDLKLAVEEREPSLAVDLLGVVKSWVSEMKRDGESMRGRYRELQEAVVRLASQAQHTKMGADQRLAEAVQAVELQASAGRSAQEQPSLALDICGFDPDQMDNSGLKADLGLDNNAGPVSIRFVMSSLARELFAQLTTLSQGNGQTSASHSSSDALMLGTTDAAGDDTAQQDLLELLFMAPGITPSTLPPLESFNFTLDPEVNREGSSGAPQSLNVTLLPESGEGMKAAHGAVLKAGGGDVDTHLRGKEAHVAAGTASRSAAALLRALRELRRVDIILQGCSAFWAHMDGTVERLAQMKDVTERLVGFATSSARLRERFDQRLGEYASFWASLERLCRKYSLDHHVASLRMQEFIRVVADAADLIDTAESARAGAMAAKWERGTRS